LLVTSLNVHRLLVTSVMVATKMLDDVWVHHPFSPRKKKPGQQKFDIICQRGLWHVENWISSPSWSSKFLLIALILTVIFGRSVSDVLMPLIRVLRVFGCRMQSFWQNPIWLWGCFYDKVTIYIPGHVIVWWFYGFTRGFHGSSGILELWSVVGTMLPICLGCWSCRVFLMLKSLRSLPSVLQTSTTISRLHLLENGCTFAEFRMCRAHLIILPLVSYLDDGYIWFLALKSSWPPKSLADKYPQMVKNIRSGSIIQLGCWKWIVDFCSIKFVQKSHAACSVHF
jgi:hypothetical protein